MQRASAEVYFRVIATDLTVSIIIPVYNRAQMVHAAIASCLGESPVSLEVIVVDDGSTDDTWASLQTIRDPRVRIERMEQNSGQGIARNRGLSLARGRYVKFFDSDDTLLLDHLPAEVAALDAGADLAVSGWTEERSGWSVTYEAPFFDEIVDDVLAGLSVPTAAVLYTRRPDWTWDPGTRKLDDWDYFCNAALGATHIATVPGPAYIWRHHSGVRETDAGLLANAQSHHYTLYKIERRLAREGRLTEARRKRLAQYFYKELRVLCLEDRPAFEAAAAHVLELDPAFRPVDEERQWFMRVLARGIGFRRAVRLHTGIKKLLKKG